MFSHNLVKLFVSPVLAPLISIFLDANYKENVVSSPGRSVTLCGSQAKRHVNNGFEMILGETSWGHLELIQ